MIRHLTAAASAILAVLSIGCTPAPQPAPQPDVTTEAWYGAAVAEMKAGNDEAQRALKGGDRDEASRLILAAEKTGQRLLAPPHPTLQAMEAVSDAEDLHAGMLVASKNYGWARLQFQKNLVRWKYWQPQTESTGRRLKQAQMAIAECDRYIKE